MLIPTRCNYSVYQYARVPRPPRYWTLYLWDGGPLFPLLLILFFIFFLSFFFFFFFFLILLFFLRYDVVEARNWWEGTREKPFESGINIYDRGNRALGGNGVINIVLSFISLWKYCLKIQAWIQVRLKTLRIFLMGLIVNWNGVFWNFIYFQSCWKN